MEYSDPKLDQISYDKIFFCLKFDINSLNNAVSPKFSHDEGSSLKCVLVSTTERKRKQKATSNGHKVTKLQFDSNKNNFSIELEKNQDIGNSAAE